MSTQPKDPVNSKATPSANNKPKPGAAASVVVAHEMAGADYSSEMRRALPAGGMSVCFHIVLLGLFALLAPRGHAGGGTENKDDVPVATESQDDV